MENRQIDIQLSDEASVKITVYSSNSTDSPIILILPAMGVKASYYEPFVQQLQQNGFMAITADLRGLGLSSVRPSNKVDFGYLEMVEDLKMIAEVIKKEFPNRKIYGLGHSLGGQIAALAQAKYPDLLDGLILTAANSVYYKGWTGKQRYANLFGYYIFNLMSQLLGYFPGHKVGFGGKAAKTQMKDWSHVGKTGSYQLASDSLDYEVALDQLKMPVLAIYIEGDWMSPKAAMVHLYQKFNSAAPITNFTLTKAATGVQLNHFNWVKNSAAIVKTIKEWISSYPKNG